jgi:hypothetical protein
VRLVRHTRTHIWRVRGLDSAIGIGCDFCGSVQDWSWSEEALADFLQSTRGKEAVRQFRK